VIPPNEYVSVHDRIQGIRCDMDRSSRGSHNRRIGFFLIRPVRVDVSLKGHPLIALHRTSFGSSSVALGFHRNVLYAPSNSFIGPNRNIYALRPHITIVPSMRSIRFSQEASETQPDKSHEKKYRIRSNTHNRTSPCIDTKELCSTTRAKLETNLFAYTHVTASSKGE
jgi:hypothetical protein